MTSEMNITLAPLGFKQADNNVFDCCEPQPGVGDIYF
jgi:hypothetical protein